MIYLLLPKHNLKRIYVNIIRTLSQCTTETMKFLNVAEKNDAAKNIAQHLSRGTSRRVSSFQVKMRFIT